jgi:arginase
MLPVVRERCAHRRSDLSSPPRLIGIPFDAASSFRRGAAKAPPLILKELYSDAGNLWSESGIDLSGFVPTAAEQPLLVSDLSEGGIETAIAELFGSNHRPLVLGGDHSITYPVMRAVAAKFGPPTILHVDAHPDLYDEFEGNRLSHACPFARIMESRLASRLVQVGIRAMNGHQAEQANRFDVEVIDMRAWARGTRPKLAGPLYISLDIDGIDPAHAPGVSHREPGGLTVREVISLVQDAPGPIVGADLVEFNPDADIDGMTARVAAKLTKELLAKMIAG